jgi:hypothetical protein
MIGMPNLPYVLVPHPIGGRKPEVIEEYADRVFNRVVAILTIP